MTTVYDVPAEPLIRRLAEKLQNEDAFKPPDWAQFVKTGVHREKPPAQPDWWYTRVAAVLRKVYLEAPIGVSHLRAKFGGAQDRGSKRYIARKSSGAIIRHSLKQLEAAGYVSTVEGKGRVLTPKGQALLDNTAHEVLLDIIKDYPDLGRY